MVEFEVRRRVQSWVEFKLRSNFYESSSVLFFLGKKYVENLFKKNLRGKEEI